MKTQFNIHLPDIEAIAMTMPGVVGVAEGESSSGEPVIKLLVNVAKDQLTLPNELQDKHIEIEYIGEPKTE